MSYTVIHKPHNCGMPKSSTMPLGTILKCDDCGQCWKRVFAIWPWMRCNEDGELQAKPPRQVEERG